MFDANDYIDEQNKLKTSPALLYAIEQYTGQMIETTPSSKAYEIWGLGATGKLNTEQEKEILEHAPTENAKDGDILFWAAEGCVAECIGGEWRLYPNE